MRRELSVIRDMLSGTWANATPPRFAASIADVASWRACLAVSAVWATVPVSSSIELDASCKLEAACSVRVDKSKLPDAISLDATETDCTPSRTSPTRARKRSFMPCMAVISEPISSFLPERMRCVRSPCARA
jgi:hypothetical protein